MKRFFRLLLGYLCRLLAAVAFLVAVAASFMCIGTGIILVHDDDWTGRGRRVFWGALGIMLLGALATWLLRALSHRILGDNISGSHPFALVYSKSGRPERFASWAVAALGMPLYCGWIWRHSRAEAPWTRTAQTAAALGALYLGWQLRVLLHELGHLGAARALGMDLVKLQVGVGPLLWQAQRKPSSLSWELRLWPGGGLAKALHRQAAGFRWRMWLFVVGGPAVDACLIWAGYQWVAGHYDSFDAMFRDGPPDAATAWALLAIIFFSAVGGLVPYKSRLGNQPVFTDGWWLLRLRWMSRKEAASHLLQHWFLRLNTFHAAGQNERAWEAFRKAPARRCWSSKTVYTKRRRRCAKSTTKPPKPPTGASPPFIWRCSSGGETAPCANGNAGGAAPSGSVRSRGCSNGRARNWPICPPSSRHLRIDPPAARR